MKQHARLAPSKAHQWMACPGSIRLSRGRPDDEGIDAREGTACHWVAERMFEADMPEFAVVPVGTAAPNGIIVNADMLEAAASYVAWVMERVRAARYFKPRVEQRVSLPDVHPDLWGSLDATWYHVEAQTLHVADLKYGFRVVEPTSPQLLIYALGELGAFDRNPPPKQIVTTIVQPRAWHPAGRVRSHTYTPEELRSWENPLRVAARLTDDPNAPLRTGSHCLYCTALSVCPAAREAAMAALEISNRGTQDAIDGNGLGAEIRLLRLAKERLGHRLDALEAEAAARIDRGERIAGFTMAAGVGKRMWVAAENDVRALGELFGCTFQKPALVSPAEAERQLKSKGADPALLKHYALAPATAPRLIEDTAGTVFDQNPIGAK